MNNELQIQPEKFIEMLQELVDILLARDGVTITYQQLANGDSTPTVPSQEVLIEYYEESETILQELGIFKGQR